MQHVQEEHKMRLKAEKHKCLQEERCRRMEEQEKSDEDMEVPQTIEEILVFKSERAQMFSVDPDTVAQPVTVGEEKEKQNNVPFFGTKNPLSLYGKSRYRERITTDMKNCVNEMPVVSKQKQQASNSERESTLLISCFLRKNCSYLGSYNVALSKK
ncbi:hypothetical protein TNCT_467591 [Trichonephila clavata]|uniref:Uncharacterized protein n=1 Tax=Trichonephila clavata TaxID=2740835 RepID=A0A8X6KP51_TRICU|nr:hypothetical protein TNCT_467591 [Trichonephila clavata]